jgi:nitrate reductase gamma subunit
MTQETLVLLFVSSGLMAFGLLAMMVGFFLGLFNPKQRFDVALFIFVAGVVALTAGAWLMRGAQ